MILTYSVVCIDTYSLWGNGLNSFLNISVYHRFVYTILKPNLTQQCTNGHLMCAGCFTHVLADARLRDEMATCPNCRIEISKSSASRNLAVEKAVSELPSECQYCNKEFPRNTLERHEESLCEERLVLENASGFIWLCDLSYMIVVTSLKKGCVTFSALI